MNSNVNFEIAKLLKEKGFNIEIDYGLNQILNLKPAPTIAEVIMWLYEKHGVWIVAFPTDGGWTFDIFNKKDCVKSESFINSPTEAYLSAIEYTLKNLI